MRYTTLLLLIAALFTSCLKSTESNDKVPPKVQKAFLNTNDTILAPWNDTIRMDSIVVRIDTLWINKFDTIANVKLGNIPDTLVMGHALRFLGHFTDNEALSAYKLSIKVDPTNVGISGDTTFHLVKGWSTPQRKEYWAKQGVIFLPKDTLSYSDKVGTEIKKAIREGSYKMRTYAMDTAENQDTLVNQTILLRRETIIKHRINRR